MRKRILPALLSVVLLLSLVPTAFAAYTPITVVQESPEDPEEEFVYYVQKLSTYIVNNASGPKVETIHNVQFFTCPCTFFINSAVPNCRDIWENHRGICPNGSSSYMTDDCYKITLKNGERVTLNSKYDRLAMITTIQDGQDQISFSTDGKNFTNYVDHLGVATLDRTIAKIIMTKSETENGVFTIKRSASNPPAPPATAKPTNDALWVDGKLIQNATIYKINGNNYFKLRDVAAVLNGTKKQFAVGYNDTAKFVTAVNDKPYKPVGGELAGAASGNQTATVSRDTIIANGTVAQDITAYKIAGSNYFKLRDLGDALGFDVDYEAGQGMMINTGT